MFQNQSKRLDKEVAVTPQKDSGLMAVSLKNIAERVNVSICSVSQVLNDHPRAQALRPETRKKILDAARELGYFKNEMAASMVRKNTRVLAFVTADMGSIEYTGRIQNGVLEAAGQCDYLVMLHRLNNSSPAETIRKLLGWRVAGVVFHVASLETISGITAKLDKQNIPWGTVNLSNPGGIGSTSNDFAGVEELTGLFSRNGHRKTAYVAVGYTDGEFRRTRESGYLSGMKKYYPSDEAVFICLPRPGDNKNTNIQNVIPELLEKQIDAVICESDHIAAALLRQAIQSGLRVPEDLSIAGFGNSVIAEYTNPPLTTVDFEGMGRQTVHNIIRAVEKRKKEEVSDQLLPAQIIIRQSVKRVRQKSVK